MTDNAGYRPTDDSALRWEDCHCVKCGEPDKQCKCVALTPGTKVIPTTDANTFYRVVQDDYCVCSTCQQDAPNWTIVSGTGDDECGIGQSWGHKETADDICDLMNMAYDAGKEVP